MGVIDVRRQLTVDSNSHALGEYIAVGTLEGGNFAELVELLVVFAHSLRGLSVHLLKLEAVGLGDGEDGGRAWVALQHVLVRILSL